MKNADADHNQPQPSIQSVPVAVLDKFQRPVRDLRISVMDKCNFRCPYCMPAEIFGADYQFLAKEEILSDDEIVRLARLFVSLGVTKLRLTGGEPLIRPNLPALIARLAAIPDVDDVALTTNAFFLPERVVQLRDAGLQRLTISLDSLDNVIFQTMNGYRSSVDRVLRGVESAEKAGYNHLKINCVVKRGVNDHTLADLATHFRGSGHIVRFIEYMDVGNLNGWRMDDVVSATEIIDIISRDVAPLEAIPPNYPGEVANRYRYRDGSGEIGIIASVTQPFCGSCTRARISAAGEYYTCLFAGRGTDLRAPMRSGADDDALRDLIGGVWRKRSDRYSELRTSFTHLPRKGAEMYRLGG
jgi:cyclic pyranopterin phosphate synthase